MTIKNVIRTNNSILTAAGGTVTTLTTYSFDSTSVVYYNGCKRATAWFEGRLWTSRYSQWGPAPMYSGTAFMRWDNVPTADSWQYQPDYTTSRLLNVMSLPELPNRVAVPGLITYKDNIYMFWDADGARPSGTSNPHSWGYMRWNPNPAPNGLTTVEAQEYSAQAGYYKSLYTKSAGVYDLGHIIDIIEHNGVLYIATPVNIMSVQPPSGDLILLDQPSTNWDNMVSKAFGIFKAGSGVAALYALDANGKVKQITGVVSEVADLTSVNPNITNGNTTSLGYGPALVQIGSYFYAFLNDTTGTVLFRTLDGSTWTEVTGSLPAGWQAAKSHIKISIDPSTPEVRVMFINAATGALDIYTFDGGTFTYLGSSATSVNCSYTFFDKDAADTELEGTVTVNAGAGTADIPFQLFREVSATGTIDVAAEYSLDGGATWSTATGTPKFNLDASDSRPAGAGAAYTFVWQWQTDLGPGLYSNVRFRIRSV